MSNPLLRLVIAGGVAGLGFAVPTKYPEIRAACWTHGLTLGVPALWDLLNGPSTPPVLGSTS